MLQEYKFIYKFLVKAKEGFIDVFCFQKEKLNHKEFQNLKKDVMKINKGIILRHEFLDQSLTKN